ncbi:MAG: hypothetical protein ACYDBZ_05115 [Steroidobacteraceae bacterium]
MKLAKLGLVVGAFALAICLKPNVGWSTRAYAAMISGEVTATPQSGEIEIAHHLYHVKADSPAAKALSSIYAGQTVDAVLDGPAHSTDTAEIVSLTIHATP